MYFRGWHVGLGLMAESYGYDPALYAGTLVERDGALVPFTGVPRIVNRDVELSFDTPRYRTFSAFGSVTLGRDANFFEWAPAEIVFSDLGVRLRPNDRLRVDASYALQWYARRSDGSVVFRRQIPRLRTEYQLSRPLSVRVITEYDAARQDDLRDDGRTGGRLFRAGAAGAAPQPLAGYARNRIRADGLVSYQPNPGTVVFAGYSSTLAEPGAFRFRDVARQSDGWFAKLSYLYRL